MMMTDGNERRHGARRAALIWGVVALAIYIGYMFIMGVRSGAAG